MIRASRLVSVLGVVLMTAFLVAPPAQAGSPHFINSAFVLTVSGSTLSVDGKEAGLGDETQVHIAITAEAACINGGSNHPRAANKATFSAAGDFPVQNGQATFSLSLTATFKPACSPPMTVVWSPVTVSDAAHGVTTVLR